jgi:hypothetical protein
VIELDWTLLAVWYGLYKARECISPGAKLSGMKTFRAFVKLVVRVATQSVLRSSIHEALSRSVVADESGRKSDKKSNGHPRKKKQRQTGEPTINELSETLWEKANAMLV